MEPILFLCHRIPYPPDKGDKLRSYHLLRELAARYRVYLGTFVDDRRDWGHLDRLQRLCAEVRAVPRGRAATLRALVALIQGRSFSVGCYTSPELACWVRATLGAQDIRRVMLFSSPVAAMLPNQGDFHVVADFVDVDSEKWRQYAHRRAWPLSVVYGWEADRLLAFERAVAARAAAVAFAADAETRLFRDRAPESAPTILTARNGVDGVRFSPRQAFPSPYPDGAPCIVFTGMMDYWPNVDAVVWFAKRVLPWIRTVVPEARFAIVGMNPSHVVRRLAAEPGVIVTGAVPDTRPYLAHARVVVAPLRVARGIQNKVLEAMAMAKPVVVTSACLQGVLATPDAEIAVADAPREFAECVLRLLDPSAGKSMGERARVRVLSDYNWQRNLAPLLQAIGQPHGYADPGTKAMTKGDRTTAGTTAPSTPTLEMRHSAGAQEAPPGATTGSKSCQATSA